MNYFQIKAFTDKIKRQKKVMDNKQLTATERTIAIAIATIVALALLASMTSCKSSYVYRQGAGWKPSTKKSLITGWTYTNK